MKGAQHLIALALTCGLMAGAARAGEVILSCTFPSLPATVMRFPDSAEATKTMEVGARPSVPLTEGQGTGRLISAMVDGYSFRFAPANSVMDVEQGGKLIASETGECVTIGGPINETPLTISAENSAVPEVQDDETQPPPPSEDRGKWLVREDKSAFDDSRTVILSLNSNEDIRGSFSGFAPANLMLRCMENTTSVFILANDNFLADIQGYGQIDLRLDSQKARQVSMSVSTDNKALGLWNGSKAIPFIKSLIGGEKLAVRLTPFNESPVEFTLDIHGLEAALEPLREACKW